MTDFVTLVEVGPRDGLQNESAPVTVPMRAQLIDRLASAGLSVIEAGAFVSPKWVPQMADTDQVLARTTPREGVRYPVLTPNMKGYEAARACGAAEVAVFAAASETFSQKNTNASITESIERFKPILAAARDDGVAVRGYVSCVLGCPYEGLVPLARVVAVAEELYALGCFEISLGDTIGVGTPDLARAMFKAVAGGIPASRLACHFHDTYGQALANLYACFDEGARVVDASVSGLGGCPYAPGAAGNAASEDVVYMLHGMGAKTGVDLDALVSVSEWIAGQLSRTPGSKVARALLTKRSAERSA